MRIERSILAIIFALNFVGQTLLKKHSTLLLFFSTVLSSNGITFVFENPHYEGISRWCQPFNVYLVTIWLGAIHKRRHQFLEIFDPLPLRHHF